MQTLSIRDWRRFWNKAEKTGGCWFWRGWLNAYGYAMFRLNGKNCYAHVLAYVSTKGPVPRGLELDHLCRHRACVNPAHLEAVPHSVNCRRGRAGEWLRRKTHCPQGHEYTPENTMKLRGGRRQCRTCTNLRSKEFYDTEHGKKYHAAYYSRPEVRKRQNELRRLRRAKAKGQNGLPN
jgi:hypothetical protein